VKDAIQLFIELELIAGEEAEFEAAFDEVMAIARRNGITLAYDFYRDPARPSAVYAIESHDDAASLGRHFQLALPALQKAWACARPVRTMILGDLPAGMREMMEGNGAVVVPSWLRA
jgi:quinol monooxygenase YgiN